MDSFRPRWLVLVLLASPIGCRPAPNPVASPPEIVRVRRADAGGKAEKRTHPDQGIEPIGFALEGVRGHVRTTMEVEGTADVPEPFVHDALFLLKGDGLLSIAIRKPWPGHPRGRVSIRCEGGGEDSTVDYEPELWFDRPDASISVEVPVRNEATPIREGDDLVLARIVAIPKDSGPIRLTLKVAFADRPIKPRLKAGVRPPR